MKSFVTLPRLELAPLEGAVPVLDPFRLGPMAEQAEAALLREGESENTLRAYRSALRYWAAWAFLRYRQPIQLPVPTEAVVQFIVDHAQRLEEGRLVHELPPALDAALVTGGFKGKLGPPTLNTLVHRIAVLSKVHQLEKATNPCAEPRVRELLAKTRRAYAKRGVAPKKKPALTREPMEALLATCDDSLTGRRDKALLLFAFSSGGRRRSEVTAATLENTRPDGDTFVFTLMHSKTNQSGADLASNHKLIAGRAADALRTWLAASGITSGAIFRRVRRGDVVGEALSPAAVRDIVLKRCAAAGLEGRRFSAHSLRAGFATEAAKQRVPIGEVMAATGHTSASSLAGYERPGATLSTTRLLDAVEPGKAGVHPRAVDPGP